MEKKKKKVTKKKNWELSAVFATPLLLLIVGLFCFKSSLPFRVDEIRPIRGFSFQLANTTSQEELERLRSVFSQSFTYLSESDQCYLFVSQNNDYLLKFFKMRKLTPKYWLNYIPLPWLEQERLNKIGHRERSRQELLGNFKSAFEGFRHQTSLFFIHFFSTEFLKSKVHIIDQQNTSHYVYLDSVPFVLQRKSVPLFEHIETLIENRKTKEAMSSLLLVLDLVKDQCQRGFGEHEINLEKDYGFIGNRVVFVDVERLVKDDSLKNPLSTLREVFKVSQKISEWLEQSHPSLATDFQRESHDLISMLEGF
jgi:hypothetical protein